MHLVQSFALLLTHRFYYNQQIQLILQTHQKNYRSATQLEYF